MDTTKPFLNSLPGDDSLTLSERVLAKAFSMAPGGQIDVCFTSGRRMRLGKGSGEIADLDFLQKDVARRIVLGGAMGLAETWMEGGWTTSDLSTLLRILARSQAEMGRIARGASRVLQAMDHAGHRLRANTRENARKNIQAHYDLSNALYETFLDPSLTYSSAIFTRPCEDLHEAQMRKIDRLIDQLSPGPDDHVLEIGSGWGACAIRLTERTGCRVTSLTLSTEQAAEARRRVVAAGVADRVEIRLQDYRDVEGLFDHIVSVEMIEAVGHEFLTEYMRTVNARLKTGGRFALQAITIPNDRYASYRKSCDFIRKHIFPGGHLPSPELLSDLFQSQTSLRVVDELEFGKDYAETLRRWRDAFKTNRQTVSDLGFPEDFYRKWLYYLAYCEAGFDTDLIHVRQITCQKTESV
ncbi:MAG: class I SAM-dependent methyltransferase [Verrucomicrobia bacterium]|nr:class I SAM-dependent methyltransferase [Verrucomicrobiota bacterium]MCH8525704.1 cyclopropane-fatty-acyl-phospholipid synthase family protein [Kiritimatiellia bacterium]